MLKIRACAIVAILSALAINPAFADDKAVAVVNGVSIPQATLEMSVKADAAQGRADTPELRNVIREDLINREIIAQEAVKNGLGKNPDVIRQTEMAKQSVLISAFMQDYAKNHQISDALMQDEYNKLKAAHIDDKEYNVRHILVATEDEAKDIIAELKKKVKFATLAKKSKDTASAENGGSLGWVPLAKLAPPFATALAKLSVGKYTKDPVQTQFGWHIIKLDEIRTVDFPPFEKIKPQLQQHLQQQLLQKMIMELRGKAKIE